MYHETNGATTADADCDEQSERQLEALAALAVQQHRRGLAAELERVHFEAALLDFKGLASTNVTIVVLSVRVA